MTTELFRFSITTHIDDVEDYIQHHATISDHCVNGKSIKFESYFRAKEGYEIALNPDNQEIIVHKKVD